jgi:heme-degrading monooxygenase HmoA
VGQAYTHSVWIVKPGHEEEFVRRWTELAEWSAFQGLAASAKLLRDVDRPNRFVSFGPWESLATVSRWRSAPEYDERIRRLQELLESFDPQTLEQVTES